jgi:hypothetical protein
MCYVYSYHYTYVVSSACRFLSKKIILSTGSLSLGDGASSELKLIDPAHTPSAKPKNSSAHTPDAKQLQALKVPESDNLCH